MRFRIPPQLKQVADVYRDDAYARGETTTVAEGVVCAVMPGKDLVSLRTGIGIKESDRNEEWFILMEAPHSDIAEGDYLIFREALSADHAPLPTDIKEVTLSGVRRHGYIQILDVNQKVLA